LPPVEVPEAAVRSLLARWFPGQTVALARVGAGASTPVYRVTVEGEVTYLRLGEEPGERRDAEVRVHELVRALGIAVPEILRWEREPPELDRSAALTSRMPGVPLDEFTGDATDALRRAGRELTHVNAIPVVGYGWVDFVRGDDRHLAAGHATRGAWAAEYVAAAETVVAARILPGATHAALRDAICAWADWPDRSPSRLAHGDFDISHIYVDPGSGAYQGIIDFGEIRGTDPCYDLGHALVQAGDAPGRVAFEGIVAGYAGVAPVDLDAVRLQAVAIATRALAIQLGRPPNAYRQFLAARLDDLLPDAGAQ
jgi:aminoglycoside phosphotransferase (APT) family kinase protein